MNLAINSSVTPVTQYCKEDLSDEQIQDLKQVKALLADNCKWRFPIVKPHSEGSQASTFLAYDASKERYLLKLLKGNEYRPIGTTYRNFSEAENEALISSQLSHLPFVCCSKDIVANKLFIQPFIEGDTYYNYYEQLISYKDSQGAKQLAVDLLRKLALVIKNDVLPIDFNCISNLIVSPQSDIHFIDLCDYLYIPHLIQGKFAIDPYADLYIGKGGQEFKADLRYFLQDMLITIFNTIDYLSKGISKEFPSLNHKKQKLLDYCLKLENSSDLLNIQKELILFLDKAAVLFKTA